MKVGEAIARSARSSGARVFALRGDLGAGKTTFVQGFLRGLGLKKRSPSPTFIIMRRHALKGRLVKNAFHVDAYRVKNARSLAVLGLTEIMADPKNVVLIEWAERARGLLPRGTVRITFTHGRRENERTIRVG